MFALGVCIGAHASAQAQAEAHYRHGVELGHAAEKASIFRKATLAREARMEFETAVRMDPDLIDARMALVEYYLRAPKFLGGGMDKAIAQAHEILRRDAAEGHRAFADIYEHQKKHAEAAKELDLATSLDRERLSEKRSQ
jgi:tetratricopeptide (TPR) repeat protein